jgi:hypothetical protein
MKNAKARAPEYVEIDGVARYVAEWARVSRIPSGTIRSRLRLGWEPKYAVFAPLGSRRSRLDVAQ